MPTVNTPIINMQELQQVGQLLVASKPLEALTLLLQWAKKNLPEMAGNVELQQSRVNLTIDTFSKGLMSTPDYQTELLKINNGILYLLEECKKSIPSDTSKTGTALHEYHAYTCDRVDHSDSFRQFFSVGKTPVQFYFLYGGDLQSHESLFRRIAYDLEGRLQDYLNPQLETSTQALQLEMTFEFSRQLPHYQQNILRSFFSMLGLQPNEHEPLLQRDLTYALERSPRLQGLKATDYVCVYLHISQYDWDKALTPAAAKWFVSEFCHEGNVATQPTIVIFFGIEYDEADAKIKGEVLEAVQKSETLQPLPELGMVHQRDIGQWLERYKQVSPNSRTRRELLNTAFGTATEHYMEDVELELKKIIDQYNNTILQ